MLISDVGYATAFARGCKKAGVSQYILLGSAGANKNSILYGFMHCNPNQLAILFNSKESWKIISPICILIDVVSIGLH